MMAALVLDAAEGRHDHYWLIPKEKGRLTSAGQKPEGGVCPQSSTSWSS